MIRIRLHPAGPPRSSRKWPQLRIWQQMADPGRRERRDIGGRRHDEGGKDRKDWKAWKDWKDWKDWRDWKDQKDWKDQ